MNFSPALIGMLIKQGAWKEVILYIFSKEGYQPQASQLPAWLKVATQSMPGKVNQDLSELKNLKLSTATIRQSCMYVKRMLTYSSTEKETWNTTTRIWTKPTVCTNDLAVFTYGMLKWLGVNPIQLYIIVDKTDKAYVGFRSPENNEEYLIDIVSASYLSTKVVDEKYRFNDEVYLTHQ